MDRISVIIVAGGSGTRMGSITPKQFLLLGLRPILVRTIERFIEALPTAEIIVVLPADQLVYWRALSQKYGIEGSHRICTGGDTRFQSVKNALEIVSKCDYIAVHDAVRPLITEQLIVQTLRCAKKNQAAIPVVIPTDSLRMMSDNNSSFMIDRQHIRMIQTPQIFESRILKSAYDLDYSPDFTDDASVVEHYGTPIAMCLGERTNIKITTTEDLAIAEALINIIENTAAKMRSNNTIADEP